MATGIVQSAVSSAAPPAERMTITYGGTFQIVRRMKPINAKVNRGSGIVCAP
jgi:hypothetical protein